MGAHAEALGLEAELSCGDVWLQPKQGSEPIIWKAAAAANKEEQPCEREGRGGCAFRAGTGAGQHALRTIARCKAIMVKARSTSARRDAEGLEAVDLEASSRPVWRDFKAALGIEERKFLKTWRGGAVRTPTRLQAKGCWWCSEEIASARHMFVECPRFRGNEGRIRRGIRDGPDLVGEAACRHDQVRLDHGGSSN